MADVTTQNVVSSTALPDWYTQYLQQTMGRALSAADEPYQQFPGQLVASMTPDQMQAYQQVEGIQGMLTPTIQQSLAGTAAAGAVNSGAAGAGSYGQATNLYNQGASANTMGTYNPYATGAAGYVGSAGQMATPYIQNSTSGLGYNSATPYVQESTSGIGMQSAQPYLSAASTSFPQAASAYMSPYTSQVTDRIAQLGARNLSENLLPSISDDFIKAGGYGSTRQRDLVGRAVRDENESVLGQQAQALEQGYQTAGQLYGTDAARQAQLAGTAGSLGTQQQQILQNAGLGLGSLGTQQQQLQQGAGTALGTLGLNQANALSGIGYNLAGLQGQDASRQIAAGQGLQGIGASQIQASQNDAARQLAAAQQAMGIGVQGQNSALQQSAALESAGAAQQAQKQQNLNAEYGQFQQQQQYPWTMIGNLSNVVQGLPVNTSTSQSTTTSTPSASPLGQAAGIGLGISGLASSGIFKARGGAVKKPKSRVSYGIAPRRGIGLPMAA